MSRNHIRCSNKAIIDLLAISRSQRYNEMDLFRNLMESASEYQKKKKENHEEQEKFHSKNPQMMDLLTEMDEQTAYLMSDEE